MTGAKLIGGPLDGRDAPAQGVRYVTPQHTGRITWIPGCGPIHVFDEILYSLKADGRWTFDGIEINTAKDWVAR